jgi:hypothetical protein
MALTAKAFKALSPGEQKAYLKKHPTSMHDPRNKRAKQSASTAIKKSKPATPDRKSQLIAIRAEIAELREQHAKYMKTSTDKRARNNAVGINAKRNAGKIKRIIAAKQRKLRNTLRSK